MVQPGPVCARLQIVKENFRVAVTLHEKKRKANVRVGDIHKIGIDK